MQPNAFSSPNVIVKVNLEAAFPPILTRDEPPQQQEPSRNPEPPPAVTPQPLECPQMSPQPWMPPPRGPRLMPPGWAVPSINLTPALSIFSPLGRGHPGRGWGEHPHLGAAAAPGEDKTDPIPGETGPVPEETAQIPGRNHPNSRSEEVAGSRADGSGSGRERRAGLGKGSAGMLRGTGGSAPLPVPARPAAAARWMRAGLARPRRREATPSGSREIRRERDRKLKIREIYI